MRKSIRKEKFSDGETRAESSTTKRILDIIGISIFAFVLPVLVINMILIIESYVSPDTAPGLLGVTPMVVVTGSMTPEINAGDMILDKKVEMSELSVGDIISFYDPLDEDHTDVITHRISEIITDSAGNVSYRTKGDANNVEDPVLVPYENIIGRYRFKIPCLGNVVLYLRTVPGMFIFVFLPILLMVGYDLLRQKLYVKKTEQEAGELRAELVRLQGTGGSQRQELIPLMGSEGKTQATL